MPCIQLQPLWTHTSSRASDQEPLVWRASSDSSRVCACSRAAVDRARNMASSWAGSRWEKNLASEGGCSTCLGSY